MTITGRVNLAEHDEGYREGLASGKLAVNPHGNFTPRAQGWNAGARDARAIRRQDVIYNNAARVYSELVWLLASMDEVGDFHFTRDARDLIEEIEGEGA